MFSMLQCFLVFTRIPGKPEPTIRGYFHGKVGECNKFVTKNRMHASIFLQSNGRLLTRTG